MRTYFDEIVCAYDDLKSVRLAGDVFQPATVTIQMDGFAVRISATGFLALSGGADCEVANVAARAVSIGTMTVD